MIHFSSPGNILAAQNQVENFVPIDFASLVAQQRKPLRFQLISYVSHSSKSAKKMKTWKPNKNGGGMMTNSPTCHRFLVLSIPESRHLMLCFTKNAQQTQTVLKWSPQVYPGCAVHVINPSVQSYVENNPVIVLNEPFIPSAVQSVPQFNIPPPVNMSKAQLVLLILLQRRCDSCLLFLLMEYALVRSAILHQN